MVRYSGRWYAVGHDQHRGEERVFRLSRVHGTARKVGQPGGYEIPAGVDIRAVARRLAPAPTVESATLLLRQGAGYAFRRSAELLETGVTGPDGTDTWDRVVVRGGADLAGEVLAHAVDVFVEQPVALRESVVARLTAVAQPQEAW